MLLELLVLQLIVSDVRNLKEVDESCPTGAKRGPYKYVESFDKAAILHNTIIHCISMETREEALVKRQKYCSTANRILCMAVRIQGQLS